MKILILCNQTQCTFNKPDSMLTICTHPKPEFAYDTKQKGERNCYSMDKRVDDSHETDIAPIQESICVHCRHRAGFCAGNDLYITQCKRFEHI
jgi:hypothetical protein